MRTFIKKYYGIRKQTLAREPKHMRKSEVESAISHGNQEIGLGWVAVRDGLAQELPRRARAPRKPYVSAGSLELVHASRQLRRKAAASGPPSEPLRALVRSAGRALADSLADRAAVEAAVADVCPIDSNSFTEISSTAIIIATAKASGAFRC